MQPAVPLATSHNWMAAEGALVRTVKIGGLIGIALIVISIVLLLAFRPKSNSNGAPTGAVSNALLGKWVCIADNASEHPTATMDFKEDGSVVLADKDRDPVTIRYKTRSAKEFWAERLKNLSAKVPDFDQTTPEMEGPDGEVIMFADQNGNFVESGFNLLFFDPENQLLANPITQIWCRPGKEEQARELTGMNAQSKRIKEAEDAMATWKPKVDVSKNWKQTWSVDLPTPRTRSCGIAVDGETVYVLATEGFYVCQSGKKKFASVTGNVENYVALLRANDQPLVVLFGTWGHDINAYQSDGKFVWKYQTPGSGIDWVTAVQIDDHNTGCAIGYNGGGGVDFVGPDGNLRWHANIDANCWGVGSATFNKGQTHAVLAVDTNGASAFDSDGKKIAQFDAGYVGALMGFDLDGDGVDEVLTLRNVGDEHKNVMAFKRSGEKLWTSDSSGSGAAFVDGAPFVFGKFGGKPMLGVADSMAIRFLKPDGTAIGDWPFDESILAVATMRGSTGDKLLVRTADALTCFEHVK